MKYNWKLKRREASVSFSMYPKAVYLMETKTKLPILMIKILYNTYTEYFVT